MDGHHPVLDIFLALDCAPTFWLEQLWARRTRDNLLRELAFQGCQQRVLHRLSFHILPRNPFCHHCLFIWEAALCCETGKLIPQLPFVCDLNPGRSQWSQFSTFRTPLLSDVLPPLETASAVTVLVTGSSLPGLYKSHSGGYSWRCL